MAHIHQVRFLARSLVVFVPQHKSQVLVFSSDCCRTLGSQFFFFASTAVSLSLRYQSASFILYQRKIVSICLFLLYFLKCRLRLVLERPDRISANKWTKTFQERDSVMKMLTDKRQRKKMLPPPTLVVHRRPLMGTHAAGPPKKRLTSLQRKLNFLSFCVIFKIT